jgi:hypothetical protein
MAGILRTGKLFEHARLQKKSALTTIHHGASISNLSKKQLLGPRKTRKIIPLKQTVIHQTGYALKLLIFLISIVYFVLFVDNCFL